eukprot:SM000078S22025  [mRNA]  locus=s78:9984:14222:- [translate_table: standard]
MVPAPLLERCVVPDAATSRLRLRWPRSAHLAIGEATARWYDRTVLWSDRGSGFVLAMLAVGVSTLGAALAAAVYAARAAPPASKLASRLSEQARGLATSLGDHLARKRKQGLEAQHGVIAEGSLTVAGLHNSGSNCFLNVILQALSSSQIVVAHIAIRLKSTNEQEPAQPPLAAALNVLLRELALPRSQPHVANPREVMQALERYASLFDMSLQQVPHRDPEMQPCTAEALGHLSMGISKEQSHQSSSYSGRSLTKLLSSKSTRFHTQHSLPHAQGHRSQGEVAEGHITLDEVLRSWQAEVRWPLEGTMGSLLVCQTCGHQFTAQMQPFVDISLTPWMHNDAVMPCSLDDCLRAFTAVEQVPCVDCIRCRHISCIAALTKGTTQQKHGNKEDILAILSECSCHDDCGCAKICQDLGLGWKPFPSPASKCLLIARIPLVLCLQLQRLVVDENSYRLQKLQGHVAFPLELDIWDYTLVAALNAGQAWTTMSGAPTEPTMGTSDSATAGRNLGCSAGCEIGTACGLFPEAPRPQYEIETHGPQVHHSVLGAPTPRGASRAVTHEPKGVHGAARDSAQVEEARQHTELTGKHASTWQDLGEGAGGPLRYSGEPSGRECIQSLLYKLVAVVVHLGGPSSGHYIVYRRFDAKAWLSMLRAIRPPAGFDTRSRCWLPEQAWRTSSVVGASQASASSSSRPSAQPKNDGVRRSPSFHSWMMQNDTPHVPSGGGSSEESDGGTEADEGQSSGGSMEPASRSCTMSTGWHACGEESQLSTNDVEVSWLKRVEDTGAMPESSTMQPCKDSWAQQLSDCHWFRISDSQVWRVSQEEVVKAEASLLLYEKSRKARRPTVS